MAIELSSEVPIWYADARTAFSESVHRLHPAIAVPSVVVPRERNYVLFPQAPGLRVAITWTESFRFDSRLFPVPSNE